MSLPKNPRLSDEERKIGEFIYQEIAEGIIIENSGWAYEQVQRVTQKLNQVRIGKPAIKSVVIWVEQVTAFITLGPYIYISRELLGRLSDDALVAFILAHEMAHYDLGHTQLYNPRLSTLRYLPGGKYLALFLLSTKLMFADSDRERQADEFGLDLCLAIGDKLREWVVCQGRGFPESQIL